MKHVFRISAIALLALAVVGNAALLGGIIVTREPAPKPLTAERIKAASQPAIVLIQSNYTVSISIPTPTISQAAENSLISVLRGMVDNGTLNPYNRAAIEQAAFNIILANPDRYYSAGTPYTDTYDQVATGSGFFVTQNGYLVTAAHVVSADKTEIHDEAVTESTDPKYVANLRKTFTDDFQNNTGITLTNTQVTNLVGFWQRWIAKYLSVDKVDVHYYLGTGTVQAGDNLTANGVRASVVSIDPTKGGHDIAIMKADISGVPTLTLASGKPHFGQGTYAIGYPRQGYLSESVPVNQMVPATVTSGKVLLVDERPSGWTAWGTSAQFTHGDSGGPVVDANGNVLGIVSYSTLDAQGNQTLGGGFFVPSQYIGQDLANQGIKPRPSPDDLTPTYYHALAEGDIQRYRIELPLLEQIKSRSPFDAYVSGDISSTQSQVLAGNDKTPPDFTSYVPAAAEASGGLVVLMLLTWMVMAIVGHRRRRAIVLTAGGEASAVEATPASAAQIHLPLESATDVVSSPVQVLRESEPIVNGSSPAPGGEKPERADETKRTQAHGSDP